MSNYNRGNGNQQKNRLETLPPNNTELEKAVLGAILIDGNLLAEIRLTLGATDFYREQHNWIYEAMLNMAKNDLAIDYMTLTEELERSGKIDDVGGAAYLVGLMAEVPSVTHAVDYARKVKELAWRREIIRLSGDMAVQAYDTETENPLENVQQMLDYLRVLSPDVEIWRGKTASKIIDTEYPETHWLIHGLMPTGLMILAGQPKIGKSWLALQIAQAVGTGGRLFGEDLTQGKVLYCALEDSERRLKNRMIQQSWQKTDNVSFLTDLPPLTNEGLAILETAIGADGYDLVIIDTLSHNMGNKLDQNKGGDVTEVLKQLQRLALATDSVIMLVDHHNKASTWRAEGDALADILGSSAKGQKADTVWSLYRDRTSADAVLKVVLRDALGQNLALQFDNTFHWILLGEAHEIARNNSQKQVIEAIEFHEGEATTKDIADYTGMAKSNVSRVLKDLLQDGKVKRGERRGHEVPYKLRE